jgi:IS1 family transposase
MPQLDELYALLSAVKDGEITEAKAIKRLSRSPHWVWVAIDPVSKLLLALDVGDRTLAMAQCVVHQVAQVVAPGCVPLFLTDGFKEYATALLTHYGHWVQPERRQAKGPMPKPRWVPLPQLLYAQVIKVPRRRRLVEVKHCVVFGTKAAVEQVLAACGWQINPSFIERVNLSIRQHVAAVGRRVMTLCKGEDGIRQQLALSHTYSNFCLPHASLRQPLPQPEATKGNGSARRWQPRTPAVAAGLTDHVWTLREVLLFRVPPWPQPQAVEAADREGNWEVKWAACARRQAERVASGSGILIGEAKAGWFARRDRLRTGPSELPTARRYTTVCTGLPLCAPAGSQSNLWAGPADRGGQPGEKPFYLISMSLTIQVTRLIQAWNQRHWIEQIFRILKHLLAAEACQARTEDAYYGHFVLRLMAGFVLFYTSRVIFKGHVTMEEIVFTMKHHWMTVDYEPFELYAIA